MSRGPPQCNRVIGRENMKAKYRAGRRAEEESNLMVRHRSHLGFNNNANRAMTTEKIG